MCVACFNAVATNALCPVPGLPEVQGLVAARSLSRTARGSQAVFSLRAKLSASFLGLVWFGVFNYALKLSQV